MELGINQTSMANSTFIDIPDFDWLSNIFLTFHNEIIVK